MTDFAIAIRVKANGEPILEECNLLHLSGTQRRGLLHALDDLSRRVKESKDFENLREELIAQGSDYGRGKVRNERTRQHTLSSHLEWFEKSLEHVPSPGFNVRAFVLGCLSTGDWKFVCKYHEDFWSWATAYLADVPVPPQKWLEVLREIARRKEFGYWCENIQTLRIDVEKTLFSDERAPKRRRVVTTENASTDEYVVPSKTHQQQPERITEVENAAALTQSLNVTGCEATVSCPSPHQGPPIPERSSPSCHQSSGTSHQIKRRSATRHPQEPVRVDREAGVSARLPQPYHAFRAQAATHAARYTSRGAVARQPTGSMLFLENPAVHIIQSRAPASAMQLNQPTSNPAAAGSPDGSRQRQSTEALQQYYLSQSPVQVSQGGTTEGGTWISHEAQHLYTQTVGSATTMGRSTSETTGGYAPMVSVNAGQENHDWEPSLVGWADEIHS
ncbi:hypothetical protein B0J12DRAFT_329381 [Macrophomina phaseolina]|uniref:Uncharacterized protein n=1 Tax=Macrophomina phaseolina TaxID=35725 RepID=A0ABQ8FV19_9PEZI|nr:hypothetical protein B0J12DRAFT_329381 [Macrophomina phaseolina]